MEQKREYICKKIRGPLEINGDLTKPPWDSVQRSPRFVDMVNSRPAILGTQAACVWDNEYLYVAFWVQEPDVQAKLTERDDLIYTENDVEFFVAGEDCYYEFEINAFGTIYEAFFIWQDAYRESDKYRHAPEFDLSAEGVDILGGFQDNFDHPRGPRWVFRRWDYPGLKTAVRVEGTLNDASDVDVGWTAELAFPWSGMKWMQDERSLPPQPGEKWLMNFFRFQDLSTNDKPGPTAGWAWRPHGKYDSHRPESFISVLLLD